MISRYIQPWNRYHLHDHMLVPEVNVLISSMVVEDVPRIIVVIQTRPEQFDVFSFTAWFWVTASFHRSVRRAHLGGLAVTNILDSSLLAADRQGDHHRPSILTTSSGHYWPIISISLWSASGAWRS